MLDAEAREGGFNDLFFQRLRPTTGAPLWYSPLLGCVCRDMPQAATGGILGMLVPCGCVICNNCLNLH